MSGFDGMLAETNGWDDRTGIIGIALAMHLSHICKKKKLF